MAQVFNIYCGWGCHLEHDRQGLMVFGATCFSHETASEIGRPFPQNIRSASPGKTTPVADSQLDLVVRAIILLS